MKGLLDEDPLLAKKTYDIAVSVANNVNSETIMNQVFGALDGLDMDDLNDRAGRAQHSYVDHSEAIWGLFEETIGPIH